MGIAHHGGETASSLIVIDSDCTRRSTGRPGSIHDVVYIVHEDHNAEDHVASITIRSHHPRPSSPTRLHYDLHVQQDQTYSLPTTPRLRYDLIDTWTRREPIPPVLQRSWESPPDHSGPTGSKQPQNNGSKARRRNRRATPVDHRSSPRPSTNLWWILVTRRG